MQKKPISVKLVLLGDSGVGKTSICCRFVKGLYSEYEQSTIGAAFMTRVCEFEDKSVQLEIWDTAGQERYHALAPMYYRGADCIMAVYDVTNPSSFTCAKKWIKQTREAYPEVMIVLVGNKCDKLATVSVQEIADYVKHHNVMHSEVSAKTNSGINDLFYHIARTIPITQKFPKPRSQNITIDTKLLKKERQSCC